MHITLYIDYVTTKVILTKSLRADFLSIKVPLLSYYFFYTGTLLAKSQEIGKEQINKYN